MENNDKNSSRIKISIRNLIIVVVVTVFIIAATELYLGFKGRFELSSETNQTVDFHRLWTMGFEKSSVEELFSTKYFYNTISDFTTSNGIQIEHEDNAYPLIKNLPTDNSYDENTVNIVVLGDSFVWGASCLNRNELFWRLVENDLRQQGYNCRVYGVGFAGGNAYDEFDWLTKTTLVDDLKPDIVIISYVFNDNVPADYNPMQNTKDLDSIKIIPFANYFKKIMPNIYNMLNNYVVSKTMYSDDRFVKRSYSSSDENESIYITKGEVYEMFENDFVAPLDRFAQSVNFPIAYMTLPTSPIRTTYKALYKPLHNLFAKYKNVSFYDCLDDFCYNFAGSEHSDNYYVNPSDTHPGSSTNRFYADYIIDFLKNDYSDILSKNTGKDMNNYNIRINDIMPGDLSLEKMNETFDSVEYSLNYPSEVNKHKWYNYTFESYFLNYPLGDDYIKLSFAQPVDIKSVEITGDKVQNIDLYYTRLNEKLRYDDHSILPFGTKSADGKVWTDTSSDKVMSLCIHADCINNDGSKLQIKINK